MNSEPLLPTVSLVVPCRNERLHIETCVRSLLAQEPPAGGYEILVVDGMSDDGTRDILRWSGAGYAPLRVLHNPVRTTPCAMNIGVQLVPTTSESFEWIGKNPRMGRDYEGSIRPVQPGFTS